MAKWEVHDGGRIGKFGDLGPTICEVHDDDTCQPLFQSCGPADPEKQQAALDLASAAPELLEQLTSLLAMCERQKDFNDDGDGKAFERARAAIAKAEGK